MVTLQQHARRVRPIGRRVFGRDPATYDRSRLNYPDRVFDILRDRCGLDATSAVLEIGPGTGKATRPLLAAGVASLIAVEPNPHLARFLRLHAGRGAPRLEVRNIGFEEARLPRRHFDLVVAATSFHWLDERRALRKVARVLKPGGWWAAWWNHNGDPQRPTPWSRAVHEMLDGDNETWAAWVRRQRQQARAERMSRLAWLRGDGGFDRIRFEELRWQADLPTVRVRGLWSTFSEVSTLAPRKRRQLLDRIAGLADRQFGGRVPFRIVTPIYTARRR